MSESQTQPVPIGNWTQYIKNTLTGSNNFIQFLIGKSGGGLDNPTEADCDKAFNASYQCGNGKNKLINIPSGSRGQTVVFDCRDETAICSGFKITLGDDGNLVMTNSKNEHIWSSNTSKTGISLEKYKAANGKYKRNFIKSGEILGIGEFIGSPSGNCYLQMVKKQDGNAGLELRYEVTDCSSKTDTLTKGNSKYSNGLYSIPRTNINNLNKVGYVTDDGKLREYPSDMITHGNNYYLLGNYSNEGNNIDTIQNSSVDGCKEKCNSNNECAGFIFNSADKTCQIKTSSMFPNSNRVPDKNSELYVRSKSVSNNASCTKNINASNAMEWDLYPAGTKMSMDTLCQLGLVTAKEKAELDAANQNLHGLSSNLESKLKDLTQEDEKLVSMLGYNVNKLKKDLNSYEKVYKVAKKHDDNFNRAAAQYEDTSLSMISRNYQYLLWTILAIIIIIGSIRVTR